MEYVMLQKGEEPTKMSFREPRTSPLRGCLVGLALLLMGACCIISSLFAMGVIKWPS